MNPLRPSAVSPSEKFKSNLALLESSASSLIAAPAPSKNSVGVFCKREQRLEDRAVVQFPCELELAHHPLERNGLVVLRFDGGGVHAAQHLGEARLARQIGAQRDGVHEAAQHAVERGVVAPGERGADDHIGLSAQPPQQHLIGRQQRNEQRRAVLRGQRPDPARERSRNRARHGMADPAGHRWTRAVLGHVEHRQLAAQLGPPVASWCARRGSSACARSSSRWAEPSPAGAPGSIMPRSQARRNGVSWRRTVSRSWVMDMWRFPYWSSSRSAAGS